MDKIVNETGAVIETYEYTAYGEATIFDNSGIEIDQSAIGNPYRFQGRRYDPESDLMYFRNRQYSPEMKRFVSMDPLGYVDSMNLYETFGCDPVNYVDSHGLDSIKVKNKQAFWQFKNSVQKICIGVVEGKKIRLNAAFGEGYVNLKRMKRAAKDFLKEYPDVSDDPWSFQQKTISSAIDRIQKGERFSSRTTFTAAWEGFQESNIVLLDALTLYQIGAVHSEAKKIKAEAVARGDKLSSFGYGMGQSGIHLLQASGAYYTLISGAKVVLAKTGASAVATTLTAPGTKGGAVVLFMSKAGTVAATGMAGYQGTSAIMAMKEGDWEEAGSRTVNFAASAATAVKLFQFSKSFGRAHKSASRIKGIIREVGTWEKGLTYEGEPRYYKSFKGGWRIQFRPMHIEDPGHIHFDVFTPEGEVYDVIHLGEGGNIGFATGNLNDFFK